jgi:hypothetical protein
MRLAFRFTLGLGNKPYAFLSNMKVGEAKAKAIQIFGQPVRMPRNHDCSRP